MDESSPPQHSEVNHTRHLSECIGTLLFDAKSSDITFCVEGEIIHAHKAIISASCDYFRSLLYGSMAESKQQGIVLEDIPLDAFKLLISYFYTGSLKLAEHEHESVVDLLGLAHLYGCEELQIALCEYLRATLSVEIVFALSKIAELYRLYDLRRSCFDYMDENAGAILGSGVLSDLSATELEEIFSRETFCAKEIEIFKTVERWCVEGADVEQVSRISEKIRLDLIATDDLENIVRPSGLINSDRLSEVIGDGSQERDIVSEYRCFVAPEINIATAEFGASVLTGNGYPRENLLKPEANRTYDWDHGFTESRIGNKNGIIVSLGKPSLINYIMIRLYDKDHRSYSYYIEFSLNRREWFRVIDHSLDQRRSLQHLFFEPRAARYIRVVGTRNSANSVFHLVTFSASFTRRREALLAVL